MIEEKDIAILVNDIVLKASSELNYSLAEAQKILCEKEFNAYRNSVSKVLTIFLVEIMSPMYVKYPELKPEELK